jgi:hypothetical protein
MVAVKIISREGGRFAEYYYGEYEPVQYLNELESEFMTICSQPESLDRTLFGNC